VFAVVLAVAAVLLAVSGGVRANVGGLRVSAQSPWPTVALSVISLGAWAFLAWRRDAVASDLVAAWEVVDRRGSTLVVAIAVASGTAAVVFATWSAAGADASGYLSEAAQWASGRLLRADSLSMHLDLAFERGVTAPLGWRPSTMRGWQAPTYPPGLPLIMSVPYLAAGAAGACLVVGVLASVAVWATGAIAITFGGGAAGVVAALVLATAPVFLFQSVQPMSDVPVTAMWLLCWWLLVRHSGTGNREPGTNPPRGGKPSLSAEALRAKVEGLPAGLACALAILIRPNLAPLALVPLFAARGARVRFAVPVVVAGVFLALLQWYWYGSPLRSGYGTAEDLFAVANVPSNLSRYSGWLRETSPLLILAVPGWWLARRQSYATPMAAFGALVVAAYLGYAVFEDWSYLRFLLPALAVGAVFVGVLGSVLLTLVPVAARVLIAVAAVLVLVALGIGAARARDAFRLVDQQRRIVQLANVLAPKLAAADVIVSGEQSGAMRFYTGREIVRWDALTTEDWNITIETLSSNGHGVWIVLDAWEEPRFRARAGEQTAALDWPPAIDAGDTHRTRAWRLADRARFIAGENVTTERIR